MVRPKTILLFVLLAVCGAYANHFHNGFHFDDSHTVLDNPAIRSLHNLPKFFTDTSTFSVLPANRTYRPMVSVSLAIDYMLGHGYNPLSFHLCTFAFFLAQLVAMYAFFSVLLRAVCPEETSTGKYISLLAMAWYGLHPAMAETVNYIIQRGDLFCTFGVIAALAIFACYPQWRRTGLYLLPLIFALLSKPPAVVFPLLLFAYVIIFESENENHWRKAALAALPSTIVCALLMTLQSLMTPKTFLPSTLSAYSYRITQPFVLLRYFGTLFLPIHLNVDTDLQPFNSLGEDAASGFIFVAAMLATIWFTAQRRQFKPIAYGLLWFLIASLPTCFYPLSEVENDHRMFLPFVGLVLAVVWAAYLFLEKIAEERKQVKSVALVVAVILLGCYGFSVRERNKVWKSDETLWLDDVQKCPHNGRGWMNYGLTQMARGAYPAALDSFNRALIYTPNYSILEINLGIVYGAMNDVTDAESHFQRAIFLAPKNDEAHYFYGRWLFQSGRIGEAVVQLKTAVQMNPPRLPAHDMLAAAYAALGETENARAAAEDSLHIDSQDAAAQALIARPTPQTADDWINVSLYRYRSQDYIGCIKAARQALVLKPDSVQAYTNIGAGYAGLHQWDQAIANEQQALRIQPNFVLAQNNLAFYLQLKAGKVQQTSTTKTPEDWLNASLLANQNGLFAESITDARAALRLRPNYAEAYNNISAGYASLGKWDEAIAAAREAIRLKPDYQLAKNNLAWAMEQKLKSGR